MIVNADISVVRKKSVVAYFKVPQLSLRRTEKIYDNLGDED
jgi:hypothetical protein